MLSKIIMSNVQVWDDFGSLKGNFKDFGLQSIPSWRLKISWELFMHTGQLLEQ